MTCQDARDLFSARADDALAAGERAALDAHLATCAECAREWQRFAATVSLLRAVEPARAPAGFVDRVLAARPHPWYRRLAHQLFVPWPVKLPLEAAAVVMIAGLAVLVFQRSPDLQQAARVPDAAVSARAPETPARAGELRQSYERAPGPARFGEPAAPAAPATTTEPAAPAPATAPAPITAQAPTAAPAAPAAPAAQAPARSEDKVALGAARTEPQGLDVVAKSSAPPPSVSDARKDDAARATPPAESPVAGIAPRAAAPPSGNVLGQARAKEEQPTSRTRQGVRDAQQPAAEGVVPTAPPPSGATAARVEPLKARKEARAVATDAVVRLATPDRAAAEREIRALVARLGGVVTVPGPDALDIVVPPGRWEEFVRELGRLGTMRVDRAPADPSATIRLSLRLAD